MWRNAKKRENMRKYAKNCENMRRNRNFALFRIRTSVGSPGAKRARRSNDKSSTGVLNIAHNFAPLCCVINVPDLEALQARLQRCANYHKVAPWYLGMWIFEIFELRLWREIQFEQWSLQRCQRQNRRQKHQRGKSPSSWQSVIRHVTLSVAWR